MVTVSKSSFYENNMAIDLQASYDAVSLTGTNASVSNDWFDGNTVSMDVSSDWSPVNPACGYLPTVEVYDNYYGASSSPTPPVSASDYLAIQAAATSSQSFPDGWPDEIGQADTDVIQGWTVLPCSTPPYGDPSCFILAIPISFDNSVPPPVACDDESNSAPSFPLRPTSLRSTSLWPEKPSAPFGGSLTPRSLIPRSPPVRARRSPPG